MELPVTFPHFIQLHAPLCISYSRCVPHGWAAWAFEHPVTHTLAVELRAFLDPFVLSHLLHHASSIGRCLVSLQYWQVGVYSILPHCAKAQMGISQFAVM